MTYNHDNIFAKMMRGDIPCHPIYEDERTLVIRDIAPAAPVHLLAIPKGTYISFDDFTRHATSDEIASFFGVVQNVAEKEGLSASGYRLIMNHGTNASQTVPHFHVHILGGTPLGGLLAVDTLIR
ncbi:MAG: HIT domain-containing protein [Alphaproteobacteria bacterium]|nr:MAG: HIT domain-containing protein [Alphaproteobacteria bacterium]TAF14166.1 MAG: HIT domain-containing protein [Alphaproteobacteria bacterium]TAF39399.1 MAG: HIT domain-containing protein [Alphaproteobacteria bacterium]TAF74942.1 MAG: HIT domain-containing protein [Alphaproteobacteria bacterium]